VRPCEAHEIISFAAPDGYRMASRIWNAGTGTPRVVLIHGIVSHSGWYLSTCRFLAARGCEVHAVDRRGSGLNMHARGDAIGHQQWLRDMEAYLGQWPDGRRAIVLGISWGGKLVAALGRHCPELIGGMGLLCPGLYALQQANLPQRFLLRAAMRSGFGRMRISIPLRDPRLFTDTPRWQAFIRDDPFTLRTITIRWAVADLDLNWAARAAAGSMHAPTLLMLAGRERIVNNGRTRAFFDEIAAADKQCCEYATAAHTLEFEPDPSSYLGELHAWIERVGGLQSPPRSNSRQLASE
jgi:alpha-beta hydrolase superfamily lysophospholipase